MILWQVHLTKNADKQAKKLNANVRSVLRLLMQDLRQNGQAIKWPNYGKLKNQKGNDKWHCHLLKGKPTYVCYWEIVNKKIKIIEVCYVGTHENAPY